MSGMRRTKAPKRVLPKLLCDVEALELIYPPPEEIRSLRNFRPYQRWMTVAILNHDAVFLGAAMGLGKTGASLSAAVDLLDSGEVKKWLVVAPLRVAENTWPEEIATWDFSRHLTYQVITGTEEERIAALEADVDITIINRENLPWLKKHVGTRKWRWDGLIYDEASRLKEGNKKSDLKRLTGFGVLARMRYAFKKVVLLSGTPAPNGLKDLWGPIFICDKGARLGTSKTAYLDRYFRYDHFTRKHEPFAHSEGQIMDALKDVFYSLKEEDYLSLPPMIERDHVVKLPPKALKMYKELEKTSVIEELDIAAVNGGVLVNKLLQLSNGSLYHEDGSATHVHDAKLEALDSIIEEAFERPILLAYSYQFDLERLRKRYPFARVYGEGKNDNRDWNAGKIRLMITHPASAGHGLNFQHGGNIAVWYGLTWSLELYQQFIKRLHRSGQKADHVMLHRIIAEGTADFDVLRTIKRKGVTQDDITDAVRVRLERVQAGWQAAA